MLKHLLLATAIGAAMLSPALAQDSDTGATQTPLPPEPTAQDQTAPPAAGEAPADMAAQQTIAPPPAEAMIESEGMTDLRAEKLIGASVYNTDGEAVGAIDDLVFDQNGQIIGVVLKVGGLLGMGGKDVGIKWDEVKMLPDSRLLQIGYSADQLEAAPAFKTREAIAAEKELERSQPTQPTQPTQ